MPGRGQPWKVGGIPDNTVTSADIKQSTIKLEDLSQEVLDELGGGSGVDAEHVVDPFDNYWFYDEFYYPNPGSDLSDHFELDSSSTNAVNNSVSGVVSIETSGLADNIARVNLCGAGLVAIDATKNFRVVWRMALPSPSDAEQAIRVGLFVNTGATPGGTFPFASEPTQRLWFKADGTGNWFTEIDDGTTEQDDDTGVAQSSGIHTFEIRSNPSTPNIEFLIDNVVEATYTTDLPTGNATAYIGIQESALNAKALWIDSLFIYSDR